MHVSVKLWCIYMSKIKSNPERVCFGNYAEAILYQGQLYPSIVLYLLEWRLVGGLGQWLPKQQGVQNQENLPQSLSKNGI